MNYYPKQALFYFPTTVLFVDDDPMFLSNIGFKIDKRIPIKLCNKPQKALEFVRNTVLIDNIIQAKFTDSNDGTESDANHFFTEAIKKIHKEIYNQDRFSYISTIVIDYSMPNINGAEFCKQIADIPLKKIMLTGEADHVTAVQLFNDGLIDGFIVKDSLKMVEELGAAIEKAQLAYFERISTGLIERLLKLSPDFGNEIVARHFQQMFKQDTISEYYVLDVSGSCLFVDADGKTTWIVIKSDKEIENYYDIALDQDVSQDVINSLKEKSMVPFFFTESDQKISASRWQPYLHQAKTIPSVENHYYAVIKDSLLYRLENERVLSHRDFLRKPI